MTAPPPTPGIEPPGPPCVSTHPPRGRSDGLSQIGETQGHLPAGCDWRLGRWQDVMADVEADMLCADLPYGERTHEGFRTGADVSDTSGIDEYAWLTPDQVHEFVRDWSPRVRGWMCVMTSHDLIPHWERAYKEAGRFAFTPLPVLEEITPHAAPCAVVPVVVSGMGVRIQGDGPANWTIQLIVARPRTLKYSRWCKDREPPKPFYLGPAARGMKLGRGKPDWLLRAILADYSNRGDLVVDTHGGLATTGVAALNMGRQFVGCEVDEATYRRGLSALSQVRVVDMFGPESERAGSQQALFEAPKKAAPRKSKKEKHV